MNKPCRRKIFKSRTASVSLIKTDSARQTGQNKFSRRGEPEVVIFTRSNSTVMIRFSFINFLSKAASAARRVDVAQSFESEPSGLAHVKKRILQRTGADQDLAARIMQTVNGGAPDELRNFVRRSANETRRFRQRYQLDRRATEKAKCPSFRSKAEPCARV